MRRVPAALLLLVVSSALLQVACFPIADPLPYWRSGFAWIALLPFLLALVAKQSNGRALTITQGFGLGYLCGIVFYLGNCYWIYQTMYLYGGLPKPVAFLILVLFAAYLGLYHAFFAAFVVAARRSVLKTTGALLLAPCAWVAIELARARVTGFPWDLLGYSQIDNYLLLRLAPLAGVMAISFLVATINAVFTFGIIAVKPSVSFSLLASAGGFALAMGLSGRVTPAQETPRHQAILLQENLSVGATARDARPLSLREELQVFSDLSLKAISASNLSERASLIVWPEAPSHLLANDPSFQQAAGILARQMQVPVIAGSIGVEQSSSSAKGYLAYDSAALFDQQGTFQGRYDKIHLVPWGEYVPFKRVFAFAQKLTEGVGDMDPGTARSVFHTGGHGYGVFICYESIFGDEVRHFVLNGAEVLVNISDDGWYGDTGAPWQHLNMARMRAVENRRWLVRDTNTGETTTIDPWGQYTVTPRHVRTAFLLPFDFESGLTLYTRFGDWFAWLCAAVAVLALGYGLLRRNALE